MDFIKLNNGTNLHLSQTDKFKTLTIVILLRDELRRDTVTSNALLPHVLKRCSKKYKNYEDITKAIESMYGAIFDASIVKKGDEHILQFFIDTLSNDDMLEEAIEFLFEIIFNPQVVDERLNEQYTNIEKENLRQAIRNKINNKKDYALQRCISKMFCGDTFGIDGIGYECDIDEIDSLTLYQHYKNLLKRVTIDILIVGDIKKEKALHIVKRFFNKQRDQILQLPDIKIKPSAENIQVIRENDDINQGKLCVGITTGICNKGQDYYSAMMLNSILGGAPNSKLFQIVREKEGLCYYVNSILYRFKMFIMITAGIDSSNYDKTVKLIEQLILDMKNGNISDENIDISKKSIKKQFESIKDSQAGLIDFYMSQYMLSDTDSISDIQRNIDAVGKKDLINAAQSLKIDTLYFLCREGN